MDYTRNTMRTAIKSLEAVIIPTVETTGQAQAIEQARLVTDFLKFVEQRIHLIADRERHQLRQAVRLATALEPMVEGTPARTVLHEARQAAETLCANFARDSESIRRQTADLRSAIRQVIEMVESASDDDRRRVIERAVLADSLEQTTADRAWLLPLGFDPDPDALPSIEEQLVSPSVEAR